MSEEYKAITTRNHSTFISYARSDGRTLARILREKLVAHGLNVWQDVVDMEGGEKWWLQIAEAIEGSAVMVLVLTEAALRSSVVHDEWRLARTVGTHIMPVAQDEQVLSAAPKWIREVDVFILDEFHPDYDTAWQRFLKQLTDPPERKPRPFTAPNLPRNFVPRPRELGRIIANLLDSKKQDSVAIPITLQGSGGFGKTALAIAACHDEDVRLAFGDGILWVQFHENTAANDALAMLNDQIKLLDPRGHTFSSIPQASARFRELLAQRDILIVLDDVWSESYLPYFIHNECAYLITTRLQSVVAKVGATPIRVDEMQTAEAADLLAKWLLEPASPDHYNLLTQLAQRLGEWALLLELVGAELQSLMNAGRSLPDSIDHVTRRLERRGVTYLDRNDEANRNAAITLSLDASVAILTRNQQLRFYELGVLPADASIPFDTIGQLWAATGGYDDLETEDALEAMNRLALFTRYDARTRLLRLHDIVRQIIIHKSGDSTSLHQALVDQWGDPHQLPDTYAWTYLIYHLQHLGRTDEIRRLLFDFDWIYKKLVATNVVALINDYASCSQGDDCHLVASAIKMSGAALTDTPQLAIQLMGRLQQFTGRLPPIKRLLDRAKAYDVEPMLMPRRVHLLSAESGVHSTLQAGAPILNAVLTPDGVYLLVGLLDGTVKIWDWRKAELLNTLKCNVGRIWSLAVQGELLAVGGYFDHWSNYPRPQVPVEVWNWRSGESLYPMCANIAEIQEGYSTHLRNNLVAVTTGASNNRIDLFDWVTQELAASVEADTGDRGNRPETAVIVEPYLLYHSDSTNRIHLWTLAGFQYIGEISGQIGHDSSAFAVDDHLYVRSRWTPRPPNALGFFYKPEDEPLNMAGHNIWRYDGAISAIARHRDNWFVCSEVIDIYDAERRELVSRLEAHSDLISSIHALEGVIITTSYDSTIRIWDWESARENVTAEESRRGVVQEDSRFYQPAISCLGIVSDSVFVGTERGHVQEWDWKAGKIKTTLAVRDPVQALAVNEKWLVFSEFSRLKYAQFHVRYQDEWTEAREDIQPLRSEHFSITNRGSIDFYAKGVMMAKLCDDSCAVVVQNYYTPDNSIGFGRYTGNEIYVIDLNTYDLELVVGEWISAAAISEEFVAGGTVDGKIDIWDRAAGSLIHRFEAHQGVVMDIQIHDNHLFSAAADQIVRIWDLKTFSLVQVIEAHLNTVNSLHVRGDLLLTASVDHMMKLFDWRSAQLLTTFTDDAAVAACAIGSDLATIIAGGKSGYVQILQANTALHKLIHFKDE